MGIRRRALSSESDLENEMGGCFFPFGKGQPPCFSIEKPQSPARRTLPLSGAVALRPLPRKPSAAFLTLRALEYLHSASAHL